MRVAYIEYGDHHKVLVKPDTPQSDLRFVLGEAEAGKTIGEMGPSDHLVVIASSRMYRIKPRAFACPISVCIAEPPFFHGQHYRFLHWFGQRFHRVFTYHNPLLLKLPNARFLAHGTTWVTDLERDYGAKSENISLIASAKTFSEGHRLRHEVVKDIKDENLDVSIMGKGYKPFENKQDGLAAYRFSVTIENSRVPAYFTEKLIDSFICESVPIYWGAPDIAHFFDVRGMIICSNKDELMDAIRRVTPADYELRKQFIMENRQRALQLTGYMERVEQMLADEKELAIGV